jgi:hypothetical protein
MRVARTSALFAVAVSLAGCGGSRAIPHAVRPKAVTRTERLAIFDDWYADGRIDGAYRCAVVRDAIRHLPSSPPMYSTVAGDFQQYEGRVC